MSSREMLGFMSNEKMEQNIMILKSKYRKQEIVTVESAVKTLGYTQKTIIKWAKMGNVPLLFEGGTVVPITTENIPNWMM